MASALLLESIPLQPSSGLDPSEATVAVLRPEDAGPEPSEALDRLAGVCWHTYPLPSGRGLQFRYEPNVLKQVEERKGQISIEDARSRVLSETQSYFSGPAFKVSAWPESAKQVAETPALQLVLCEDEGKAKSVCSNKDDTDPQALMPREYQNAVFAVAPTQSSLDQAIANAQRLMAAEQIEKESKGEGGKLVREQLSRIRPELAKHFRLQACRAFDRVVFAGGTSYAIEEKYQVPDEQILRKPEGQRCLRSFLEAKELIYQGGDALDVQRFLKNVLPGTIPCSDSPYVYTAKAVHERFLGAPGLRLIPDGSVVRQTLLRAVAAGKIVIRTEDGSAYDGSGRVSGPTGKRRRSSDTLTTVALDDEVLVTPAGSAAAAEWVREDAREPGKSDIIPPPPPVVGSEELATDWDAVLELAASRPLIELHLIATTPSDAGALAALAQPLGADSLSLSVTVSGQVKSGGRANLAIADVASSSPVKPLDMAGVLHRAMIEGAQFEADLKLDFGEKGRAGLRGMLQKLMDEAPDSLQARARFGKPDEDAS